MTGIVVGVDGSPSSAQAVAWAVEEAASRDEVVTAVLAYGLLDQHHPDVAGPFDPHYGEQEALAALDAYLRSAVGPVAASLVERRAVCDLPARALLEAARDASLLVVGARGLGGFRGLLLGSVSQRCLHHAPCPIAVIHGDGAASHRDGVARVVVGVDGSDTGRRALQWAVEEACARRASLEVVHAWHLPYLTGVPTVPRTIDPALFEGSAQAILDHELASVDTTGLAQPVQPVLACGGAASMVLETAKGADVVVVGARGRGGFGGLLVGSVSDQVAHHASCPVVVVPTPEA